MSTVALFSSKTKMSKKKYTYDIGNNRLLTIAKKYDQLCIEEKGNVKSATFTPSRWASFLLCLDEINSQLEKFAAGDNAAYRCPYGGGWCVSVTSDFTCVDLRQFYQPFGKMEWKPTRTGIALRLSEWETFRKAVSHSDRRSAIPVLVMQRNHPIVANFTPCFLNESM